MPAPRRQRASHNEKGLSKSLSPLNVLAGSTGLEPAASGVTGRRSNQLNYDPEKLFE
jgi:hypothetical protein